VIDLSQRVLAETQHDRAIAKLVRTAQDVVDCDRIGLFMYEQGRGLVCQAAPAGGEVGWVVRKGEGIVGKVAMSGKTVNIANVRRVPELMNSADSLAGPDTRSVLCVGLKDHESEGHVSAVFVAINKRGEMSCRSDGLTTLSVTPIEQTTGEAKAFDKTDEQLLRLLLTLTSQQLHVLALSEEKARATRQVESLLTLVGSLSTTITDLEACLIHLADTIRVQLGCKQVFIFLADGTDLVCRVRCPKPVSKLINGVLQFPVKSVGVLGEVYSTGEPRLLGASDESELHAFAEAVTAEDEKVRPMLSALVCPLLDEGNETFGVVVGVNKDGSSLGDAEFCTAPGLLSRRLSQILTEHARQRSARKNSTIAGTIPFTPSDLEKLSTLLLFAAHAVRTAEIYSRQNAANNRLRALLRLCTDSVKGLKGGKVYDIIYALCKHGRELFNCDRCSFFAVDPLWDEIVLWYLVPGEAALQKMRVPKVGAVGYTVDTGEALNIRDAQSDSRFANETDRLTGYKTNTVMCQPITSRTGQVVAALQCVNKANGAFFDADDDETCSIVSNMFSDMLRDNMPQASIESLMERTDVNQDVKEVVRMFTPATSKRGKARWPSVKKTIPHKLKTVWDERSVLGLSKLNAWNFNRLDIDDSERRALVPAVFRHLDLLEEFRIGVSTLDEFIANVEGEYSDNPYHNWAHAFGTFHIAYLLLVEILRISKGTPDGVVLLQVDRLAVLLAALGHDAGHRGFNNTFETVTQSELALRYNDYSPLENHHASITCRCLQTTEDAVTDSMRHEDAKRMRAVVIKSILDTDMARHNDSVLWLNKGSIQRKHEDTEGGTENSDNVDTSKELSSAILHCADLGHPVLPWAMHKRLSLLACQEFFNQFCEEKNLGLPTLPFMGKDPNGPIKEIGTLQSGFINFVVFPLWSALHQYTCEGIQFIVDNVQQNGKLWGSVAEGQVVNDMQPYRSGQDQPMVLIRPARSNSARGVL